MSFFVVNLVVLALSVKVNDFQEYFCKYPLENPIPVAVLRLIANAVMADLFPLGLSITTLVILVALYVQSLFASHLIHHPDVNFSRFIVDFAIVENYSGRPQFTIPLFAILSVFWLGERSYDEFMYPANSCVSLAYCHSVQRILYFSLALRPPRVQLHPGRVL